MELILLPVISAVLFAILGKKLNQWVAFALSAIPLIFLVSMVNNHTNPGWTTIWDTTWLSVNFRFTLGYDGFTGLMLFLTNILVPVILLAGVRDDENKTKVTALALLMQGALNGVFMAKDGLMFYIFWELALIPIYFITLSMKHKDAFKITLRFFIYTFVGSLAMLASLMYIVLNKTNLSFAYQDMLNATYSLNEAILIGGGFLIAFLVKIPVIPFHSWQADTYTESPSVGSMLLSGIMLKMGLYGMMRWFMPLFPESLDFYRPWIMAFAVAGVVYGAIIALRQNDMKRMIAFSSLSHVALITAGIISSNKTGFSGAALQMFVHGVNAVGLFLVVEIIESKLGTRNLDQLGGLAKTNRLFTISFVVIALGAAAVPFTNGFPGEFLLLKSVFEVKPVLAVLSGLTIILCAAYMLRMLQFSLFGDGKVEIGSLALNQVAALIIILVLVIAIGFFPQVILDFVNVDLDQVFSSIELKGALA